MAIIRLAQPAAGVARLIDRVLEISGALELPSDRDDCTRQFLCAQHAVAERTGVIYR